jgi:hypothetical protein
MRNRWLRWSGGVAAAVMLTWGGSVALSGQAPGGLTVPRVSPETPRDAAGRADLHGFWDAATLTPLERAQDAELTPAQAEALERAAAPRRERASLPSDPTRTAPPVGGDGSTGAAGNVGGYNNFWIDSGTDVVVIDGRPRTAIVVQPANGRVPPISAAARQRQAEARRSSAVQAPTADAAENQETTARGAYDDPELRPLAERCLIGFGSTAGPPALPVLYNNVKQIVVTPDSVMLLNEMNHDVRVVRMSGGHAPASIRKWLGDSIGHWEGDTLVVETTNFTEKTRFRGSSPDLKVTERFTRVNPDTLLYQFTVDDPSIWDSAWSGEYIWQRSEEPVYEYACHEGNHAFGDILRGARLLEAEAEAAQAAERR